MLQLKPHEGGLFADVAEKDFAKQPWFKRNSWILPMSLNMTYFYIINALILPYIYIKESLSVATDQTTELIPVHLFL